MNAQTIKNTAERLGVAESDVEFALSFPQPELSNIQTFYDGRNAFNASASGTNLREVALIQWLNVAQSTSEILEVYHNSELDSSMRIAALIKLISLANDQCDLRNLREYVSPRSAAWPSLVKKVVRIDK